MLDRFLLLFAMSIILALANSQQPSTAGFISIDCGNANSKYMDPITKMSYVSDEQFIDAGSNFDISSKYINSTVPTRELNLRSFPDGLRNCYRLKNVSQYRAYLVRATFMYGNYDGKNSPTEFDLHIEVNYWKTIIISDPSAIYTVEALSYATANLTSVCLINTGSGTPFISSLELRPLKEGYYGEYVNASQSVVLVTRRNFGASDTVSGGFMLMPGIGRTHSIDDSLSLGWQAHTLVRMPISLYGTTSCDVIPGFRGRVALCGSEQRGTTVTSNPRWHVGHDILRQAKSCISILMCPLAVFV
ncbi:receptor-like serine threonine-protein kinase [Musa troglodytarum]|uniref:Receptor-like serine threonine-protein kinase n=1 Tax=Musa troglodytarum TaxID=320322 RepID=A0A9E7FG94_9LILI|nr:receptor-like serine threonine-protein kinase [Musa troglodytarum]